MTLGLFVRNCPAEGLKILSQKCDDCDAKKLSASLEPDHSSSQKVRKYKFHIDYPAGPDLNVVEEGAVGCRLRLKTNHPDAPDLEVKVYYQPY